MFEQSRAMRILHTVGAYVVLLVVLHPIVLIVVGGFGLILTGPSTPFGPSLLERFAPTLHRPVIITSFLLVGIGTVEIVLYYKILPEIRATLSR